MTEPDRAADPDADTPPREDHRWPRVGLLTTVVLIACVVVALPFAFASMQTELLGRQQETLYEFPTGQAITVDGASAIAATENFYNLAITSIDESNGTVGIALSAERECAGDCPALHVVITALGSNAPLRQGLPPSVAVDVGPAEPTLAESITLPVEGWPSLYPFDAYTLRLGIATSVAGVHGRPTAAGGGPGAAVGTVQNASADLLMDTPRQLDPSTVAHASDADRYLGVMELTFRRPLYLRVLGLFLPLLVALSTGLSLVTRNVNDLLVGVGSLVIGIWGVRAVLVPSGYPVVTTIDLSLSMIILLLLLALAIRSARQFHRRSALPPLPLPVPPRAPTANPRARRR